MTATASSAPGVEEAVRRVRLPLVGLLTALLLVAGCSADPEAEPGRPGTPPTTTGTTTAPPPAAGDGFRVRTGPVLGRPARRDRPEANAVVARLLELVAHTPRGERIRIVGRSFSLQPVASALIDAHERGVHVQVVVNGKASRGFRAAARMRDALGTDRRSGSFFLLSPRTRPTVHQKIWTFSRTGASRRVALVGSTNLSYTSVQQFSDMYAFVGRADLWRVLERNFRDRAGLAPGAARRLHIRLGSDRLWLYPGWRVTTDPVQRLLTRLPARGLHLRVVTYAWFGQRGDRIARIVVAKARRGARVEVVGDTVGGTVRRILSEGGIPVLPGQFRNGDDVHSKLILASWTDASGRPRRTILTGSDNHAEQSLRKAELLIAIAATRSDWRSYGRWYADLVARARRTQVGFGTTNAASEGNPRS